MPKHRPIKFETTLEPSLKKHIARIIKEDSRAKTTLNAVLAIVAVGGVLTFGAAFPALLGELGKIRSRQKKESYEQYQKIWRSFHSLKKQRVLEFIKEEDGKAVYRLTKKGKEKIRKFVFEEIKIEPPKEWDGEWRLVIFDIPEKRRRARVALRKKLKELGFFQCQKSAWIHPFPCVEEIEFIKDFFNVKSFVKLFLVREMTDGKVLYHFSSLIKKTIVK